MSVGLLNYKFYTIEKMNIKLNATNYGYEIVFEAENVKVSEDIESRTYSKTEDGKTDFSKPPKRDISTDSLAMISSLLDDMIYYRSEEFDSSDLIHRLFDKLPESKRDEMLAKFKNDYEL